VFPDTGLARLQPTDLNGQWRTVSHIALDAPAAGQLTSELGFYKRKFNLDPVPPQSPFSAMNHIMLCFGTITTCSVPQPANESIKRSCGKTALAAAEDTNRLWAQITSPMGPSMYRCATPIVHAGSVDIPRTARWRWLARDETSWRWCPFGCCEVNGDQFQAW
jgi:hypothetical protein